VNTPAEQHEMVHRGTDRSGAQEWFCPSCGRHFIVRWLPSYERMVLAEGDGNAAHTGSNGDVRVLGARTAPGLSPEAEHSWRQWLADNGIDWDGWVA
jgi:hypothetical protein